MAGFDPGQDLALFDHLEQVQLLQGDASDVATIFDALCRPVRPRRADPQEGIFFVEHANWYVPVSATSVVPEPGDVILTSDRLRWKITAVQKTALNGVYKCETMLVAVDRRLDMHVDVLVAQEEKTAAGQQVPRFRLWVAGVPACIVPLIPPDQAASEADRQAQLYRVILGRLIMLGPGHVIRAPQGVLYRPIARPIFNQQTQITVVKVQLIEEMQL